MKNLFLLLLMSLFFQVGFSQVGINTTMPDAQLDIKSSNQATPANNDGILIPKIDAFPVTNPTVAQNSMMVYLTTISAGKQPGFYYWDNATTSWIGFLGKNAGWTTTGNAGTNAGTNFIGTTDNQDLVFKRNNIVSGKITANNTAFGTTALNVVSAGTNNSAFGNSALISNTIGGSNTAVGSSALNNNVDGNTNSAFGNDALHDNIDGYSNTAFGSSSLFKNTTGLYNVAMGAVSLTKNTEGIYNTAVGSESLYNNTLGSLNTAIGFDSGLNITSGSNNIAVGANAAVPSPTTDNQMSIGNIIYGADMSTTALGKIGIGVPVPTEKLEVAGKTKTTSLQMTTGAAAGSILVSDASGNGTWTNSSSIASGTLDQAYDFGGAGLGKSIIADAGAVTINGTDGLVVTGTVGSGALVPSGAGTRMVWNPRKGAFRAGNVAGTEWDDSNLGIYSTAFGAGTTASGIYSTAFGSSNIASGQGSTAFGAGVTASGFGSTAFGHNTTASAQSATSFGDAAVASGNASTAFGLRTNASGFYSTAFGYETTASYNYSTAFGGNTTASNNHSTAFGNFTTASGEVSTAFGRDNIAPSFAETVVGIGATTYIPSVNGFTRFQVANATDRLLVVGNAIDTNNNFIVDSAERSNALVILKNGNTGIGVSVPTEKLEVAGKTKTTNLQMTTGAALGRILTSDATGNGTWTATSTIASGTLDQAYDFGGAGLGRTITADAGAVTINGTDGFLCTGTYLSGAPPPSGYGIRAFWYPKKAAFRAGGAASTEWDDANIGDLSVGLGWSTKASGGNSMAFGVLATASGEDSVAIGSSTSATGENSSALGSNNQASGFGSTALGVNSSASGRESIVLGSGSLAGGDSSLAFGKSNTAFSFGETVVGLGASIYTPTAGGTTGFATANATDRLFVVGNSIDLSNNGLIEPSERSDALVILKNGNMGIGNSAPSLAKLQVQGAVGNTVATFNLSANSKGVALVSDWPGVYFNSYYSGGTRSMASTGYASIINTDQSTGGLFFQTTNVANTAADALIGTIPTRMTITGNGNVGIGAITPGGQFELSLDQGRKPGTSTWTITSDERLKNIHGNYSKGLDEILKLQPITYNYVNTGKRIFEEKVLQKEFLGFSAQAVQKVFPEAVDVDDDEYLNFNMHPILVAFVNAFKELDTKNKTLEVQVEQIKIQQEKINSLETINTEILKRLEKLENK